MVLISAGMIVGLAAFLAALLLAGYLMATRTYDANRVYEAVLSEAPLDLIIRELNHRGWFAAPLSEGEGTPEQVGATQARPSWLAKRWPPLADSFGWPPEGGDDE